ncbi:unnamed protein product (mitochondrion) [Plasmodiophora brassicae]|uniref:Cyclin-dependent kinase 2 homolog n=1 Tax=Plasmodiophora brassicae TaxID=37360 RepID=A0A3P3YNB9_PLABS|nr:unnamed protein product [Plasmodiophora brassicae]
MQLSTARDLHCIEQIGRGTYGTVWKAFNASRRLVAVKRLTMEKETEGFPVTALREVKILQAVRHPNIIWLESCDASVDAHLYRTGSSIDMVFPYHDHDLAGLIENDIVEISPAIAKYYLQEILKGLDYLHSNHVMHRDMKSSNILINNDGRVRIADFGLARFTDMRCPDYTNRVVTMWYRPPELFMGVEQYDCSVDMWSVGCIMAELVTGAHPFQGTTDLETLDRIFRLCGTPTRDTWPGFERTPWYEHMRPRKPRARQFDTAFADLPEDARDLLDGLLCLDPARRLTARQALQHAFFRTEPLPITGDQHPQFPQSHELKCRALRAHRRAEEKQQQAIAAATASKPPTNPRASPRPAKRQRISSKIPEAASVLVEASIRIRRPGQVHGSAWIRVPRQIHDTSLHGTSPIPIPRQIRDTSPVPIPRQIHDTSPIPITRQIHHTSTIPLPTPIAIDRTVPGSSVAIPISSPIGVVGAVQSAALRRQPGP